MGQHFIRLIVALALVAAARAGGAAWRVDPALQTSQSAALKIVVVAGENAVNIIQQRTAVAPVIEVRDRNNQPVSGAVVKFAIQKGKASFDGARTLTVTTNAAGRATATGLTATGNGALQITASAAFQGQTAAATIAQTTVATAAEASSAAAGTGASGGGLSHGAIAGIVGGAGAGIGAAVYASKKSGGQVTSKTLTGPFNSQLVVMTTTSDGTTSTTCVSTRSIVGTMTIQIDERPDGTVTGRGNTNGTETETAVTQSQFCSPQPNPSIAFAWGGPINGPAANITFGQQSTGTSTSPATVTSVTTFAFAGALSNGVITGIVMYSERTNGQQNPPNPPGTITGSGSVTMPVTLR